MTTKENRKTQNMGVRSGSSGSRDGAEESALGWDASGRTVKGRGWDGRWFLPEEGGPAEEAKPAHTGILNRGWWWRRWRGGGRFLYPDHSLCSTVMVA